MTVKAGMTNTIKTTKTVKIKENDDSDGLKTVVTMKTMS